MTFIFFYADNYFMRITELSMYDEDDFSAFLEILKKDFPTELDKMAERVIKKIDEIGEKLGPDYLIEDSYGLTLSEKLYIKNEESEKFKYEAQLLIQTIYECIESVTDELNTIMGFAFEMYQQRFNEERNPLETTFWKKLRECENHQSVIDYFEN